MASFGGRLSTAFDSANDRFGPGRGFTAPSDPFSTGPSTLSTSQIQDLLAGSLRSDFTNFAQTSDPIIKEQIASLNDNSLVTNANRNAGLGARLADLTQGQDRARFGLNLTPEQRAASMRLTNLRRGADKVGAVNNARVAQQDRNANVARDLAIEQQAVTRQGNDLLAQANGLGSSRNSANAAAKANASSAGNSLAVGIASMFSL